MKPLHVISAVIGGAIAGAAVGLLLAPEKGTDTRSKILKVLKEQYSHVFKKDKMEELADELVDAVENNL